MTNNKSKKRKSVSINVFPQINDLLLRFGHNFQYNRCNIRKRKLMEQQHSKRLEINVETRIDKIIEICLRLDPNFNVKKAENLNVFLALDEKESQAFISAQNLQNYENAIKKLEKNALKMYTTLTSKQPKEHTDPDDKEKIPILLMATPVISEPKIEKLKAIQPKIYRKLLNLHTKIETQPEISLPFLKPVAEFEDVNHQKYQEIIKHPIDLRTIRHKLNNYTDPWDYIYDMNLMFDNCRNYYRRSTFYITKCCDSLFEIFDKEIQTLMISEGYCCGSAKIFDARILKCSGQIFCKIPFDTTYYSYEGYLFCESCFNNYDQHVEFEDGDLVPKAIFSKEYNKGERREPFVKCEKCRKSFHQLCVTFNPNIAHKFICKCCRSNENFQEFILTSRNLPETKCSRLMEQKMKELLDHWSNGDESERTYIDKITIRCISEHSKVIETKPNLSKFIKSRLEYVNRTIFAFIQIDKHDVVFFGIHIHLFSVKKYAYLAYMDSVLLIKESAVRRKIYQAIVLALFDYLKSCGFQKIFIWSCPPKNRDDYIFHIKPQEQKNLTQTHLNEWYERLFDVGFKEGIVYNYYHIMDHMETFEKIELFEAIPYFEGDLWNLKIEELLKLCMKNADRHAMNALADRFTLYKMNSGSQQLKIDKNHHKGRKTLECDKEDYDFQNEFLSKLMEVIEIFKLCYYVVDFGDQGDKGTISFQENLPQIDIIDDRIMFLKFQIHNSLQHSDQRRMVHSTANLLSKIFNENKICVKCSDNISETYPSNFCSVCSEEYEWEDVSESDVPISKKKLKNNKNNCDIADCFVNILNVTRKIRKTTKKNKNSILKNARKTLRRKHVKFKQSKRHTSQDTLNDFIRLYRTLRGETSISDDLNETLHKSNNDNNYEIGNVNGMEIDCAPDKKRRGRKPRNNPERFLLSKSMHLNKNASTSKFYLSTYNRVVEFKECYIPLEKIACDEENLENVKNSTENRCRVITGSPVHVYGTLCNYYRNSEYKMHRIRNRIIKRENIKVRKLNFDKKPVESDDSDEFFDCLDNGDITNVKRKKDENNNNSTFEMKPALITLEQNLDIATQTCDLKPETKRINRLTLRSFEPLLTQQQEQKPKTNRNILQKSELLFYSQPKQSSHLSKLFCTSTPKRKLILNFNHSYRKNFPCNCNDAKCKICDPLNLYKPFW